MGIITKVGVALQQLLGTVAEEVAAATQIIVRKRKFSGLSLARTFVLGFFWRIPKHRMRTWRKWR